MRRNRFFIFSFAFAASVVVSGCSSGSSTPPISVSFAGSNSQTIAQGQSATITASVSNDPAGKGVTWKVTGPGVLSKETSTSVEYDAPAGVPSNATAIVTATAVADPTICSRRLSIAGRVGTENRLDRSRSGQKRSGCSSDPLENPEAILL